MQPASIDVTSGPGTFTFSWTARDYGSGMMSVYVSLNYPDNPGATQGCAGTRVSGPFFEGTFTCTVTFAQNSPSRTWSIEYISAQDVAGNRTLTSSLAARGWPTQVTVTGAAAGETPPAP